MTQFACPHCGKESDAKRVDRNTAYGIRHGLARTHEQGWDEWTWEISSDRSQSALEYYRRLRQCPHCREVFATAEIAEETLDRFRKLEIVLTTIKHDASQALGHVTKHRDVPDMVVNDALPDIVVGESLDD